MIQGTANRERIETVTTGTVETEILETTGTVEIETGDSRDHYDPMREMSLIGEMREMTVVPAV